MSDEIEKPADGVADFPTEGSDPFGEVKSEESVKETPSESPAETKPTEPAASPQAANTEDESKLPFHKHPRWKSIVDSNKEMKREREQMKQELEAMRAFREEAQRSQAQVKTATSPAPAWFSRIFGDDQTAWSEYQGYDSERRDQIKQEIRQEFEQKQVESAAQQERYQRLNDDAFTEMEDEGLTFDRNRLMNFILEYNEKYHNVPQNTDGSINFRSALELMNQLKGNPVDEKSQERKKLAAATTASPRGATPERNREMSLQEVHKMDWSELR